MTPRERAVAACQPFPVPRRMIGHFPNLIGRNAPGSGSKETYFTDEDLGQAIAMPASEAQLLHDISAARGTFDHAIEIGAYVGWSTAHLLASKPRGAYFSGLTVVDPFVETGGLPGETEDRFYANIEATGLPFVWLVRAASPDILPIVKPHAGWDFAVIDGNHNGEQPRRDIEGLHPHLTSDAIVVFHDAWLTPVGEAINWLKGRRWQAVELPTANRMTICYRGERPSWLNGIEAKAREYVAVSNG